MTEEKKLVSVGVRMPSEMADRLKRLADVEEKTESALVRMAVSLLFEERERQYRRLHSIFGEVSSQEKTNRVEPCSTALNVEFE